MSTFTERVAQSVGRHFVTLSCAQHPHDGGEMRVHVFSGFVVAVEGEWFYVTAGHILRRVQAALAGGSTFGIWRLGDQTAGNRFAGTAIPYAFEIDRWFVLDDSDAGLDYATVHLGGLYRQLLEAGGVLPLGSGAWSDHTDEHEHWALVGIPSESVSYNQRTQISARVVVAPLTPTSAPESAGNRAQNQFYAKLLEDSDGVVKDIDGMSGGPIFMLCDTGETWKYNLIGVQSAWYRDSRVIAACPFTSFGVALEPIVREAIQLAQQRATSAA